ncbi:hypothetical protein Lalb_Chr01g0000941 [Lupinus albus]|uniref:Uncharacterized protein n=1 Tax=Lupinus albus TaxID=3870 RepID=A0A6A4R2A3_LUPAL|nr:hypothetical protein Lalb_Chr01g0000941 [Lupinus albus]
MNFRSKLIVSLWFISNPKEHYPCLESSSPPRALFSLSELSIWSSYSSVFIQS